MNFPCDECDNGRVRCKKCGMKHGRYCGDHLKDNFLFRSQTRNSVVRGIRKNSKERKTEFYCTKCFDSYQCTKCYKTVEECMRCASRLDACEDHWTFQNLLGDHVCSSCYENRHEDVCSNCSRVSYEKQKCSNCEKKYCDGCAEMTNYSMAPMTLIDLVDREEFSKVPGFVHPIGCPRNICEFCLNETSIEEIQKKGARVWAERGFPRSYGRNFPFEE